MDLKYFKVNETEAAIDGKFDYIQQKPLVAIPYLTVICLATTSGSIGNVLVIGAVLVNKQLKKVGNMLIVNLAIADLCVSSFVNPFTLVGIIYGEQWFEVRRAICRAVASICLTTCICSLLNIGSISLNRFVHIVHHEYYTRIYTVRNTVLLCIGLWVISFLLEMPNFLGWGGHVYDNKTLSCAWDRTADYSYSVFFIVVGVVFPVLLISACYLKIYLYVLSQKKKVACVTEQLRNKDLSSRGRRESMKLARTLFIIFVVFALCWIPYGVIILADPNDQFPQELHMFALLIAHVNSSLNSVLYGLFDKNFRDGYMTLLGIHWCKQKIGYRNMRSSTDSGTQCKDTEYKMPVDNDKPVVHM